MTSQRIIATCLLGMALYGCHKRETPVNPELLVSTSVFHHSDSVYRNINTNSSHDTIYSSGIYADTTMSMMTLSPSAFIFNNDTLSQDSAVASVLYYHYNSPVFVIHPYTSTCRKDTATGEMHYIRRTHVAASAAQIEHLWK